MVGHHSIGTAFLSLNFPEPDPQLNGRLGDKATSSPVEEDAPSIHLILPPPLSSPPTCSSNHSYSSVHPGIRLLFWSLVFVCFLFIYLAVVCSKCDLGPNLCPLYETLEVLTTGSPGASLYSSVNRLLQDLPRDKALCSEAPLCQTVMHIWLRIWREGGALLCKWWVGSTGKANLLPDPRPGSHVVLCRWAGGSRMQAPCGNLVQALILRDMQLERFQRSTALLNPSGLEAGMAECIGQDEKCGFSPCGGITLISKQDTGHNGHW